MRRYEPKPWDIRRCDMIHTDEGEYVLYRDAQTEIERLTAERNETAMLLSLHMKRAEKAEAKRDEARAQAAAAFVAAENALESRKYGDPDEREEYAFDAALDRGIVAIRRLTPADAKAALEAYGREKVREGMQRAADIALCHSDDRPRRYSMGWNDGYIDGCKGASDAILAEMEKLK